MRTRWVLPAVAGLFLCGWIADEAGWKQAGGALLFASWLGAVLWVLSRRWVWVPYVQFFRWLRRREEDRQRIVVVAKPVPPPYRTRAEMDALVQSWLDGTLLPETPKRAVIRTTVYIRRTETEE